jgi:hypothetical protein
VNATERDEITAYVEGVRRALAGLSETTRDELLEDLPEHLAEVRAEGTGTLVDRLGTPEAYAAELRASAGVVGGFPEPPPHRLAALIEARDSALRVLHRADLQVGPVIGYEKASDFLILLRPAWWVLRGYLVAMALAYLIEGSRHDIGLLPRVSGNDLVALVLLGGCLIVSILLGKQTANLSRWPRYALWSGTAVLVLFALGGFVMADDETRNPGYADAGSYEGNPYSYINDVYVYDSQGRPLTGVRLYDQDGNPIQLGNNWCSDPNTGESMRSRSLGYPYCPQNEPFGAQPSASWLEPAATSAAPERADPSGAGPSSAAPAPSGSVKPSTPPSR